MATHGPTSWLGHGVSESRSVLRELPGAQTGPRGPSGACLPRVPGRGSAEAQSLSGGPAHSLLEFCTGLIALVLHYNTLFQCN